MNHLKLSTLLMACLFVYSGVFAQESTTLQSVIAYQGIHEKKAKDLLAELVE